MGKMKKVIGISVGSSKRNHKTSINLYGQMISIERIGTDGDYDKARKLFQEFDGKVDAFGLGGIDLSLGLGKLQYPIKSASKLIKGFKSWIVVL